MDTTFDDFEPASEQLLKSDYVTLSMSVVFFYDWLLTIPAEYAEIWSQKRSLAKILYLFTRYLFWMFWAAQLIQLFMGFMAPLTSSSYINGDINPSGDTFPTETIRKCTSFYMIFSVLGILGRLGSMSMLTLRAWAIYGAERGMLLGLGALSCQCSILSIMSLFEVFIWTPRKDLYSDLPTTPSLGASLLCGGLDNVKAAIIWYPTVAWGGMVFNVTMFVLMFNRKWEEVGVSSRAAFWRTTLQNGCLYYLTIAVIDAVFILFTFNDSMGQYFLSDLMLLNFVLHIILMSRLVLDFCHKPQIQI